MLVGGVACAAALVALAMAGASAAARLAHWLAGAVRLDGVDALTDNGAAGSATSLAPAAATGAVLDLAAPLLAAAAVVALAVHVAQTRAPWLPRRRLAGAPVVEPARTRRAALDLAGAAIAGAVAFGWLWLVAPRLAALTSLPLAGALAIASAVATLAIAWVAVGVVDALVRHRALAAALHMTAREKREDERLAGADPRWRAVRARARTRADDPSIAIAGSTLLVLGDDVAVAIAWDPLHRPIPTRTAAGRAARATQLLALARRHALPVHRDPALARTLAADLGPVPEPAWPRLAELVAAVRR